MTLRLSWHDGPDIPWERQTLSYFAFVIATRQVTNKDNVINFSLKRGKWKPAISNNRSRRSQSKTYTTESHLYVDSERLYSLKAAK